MSPLLVYLHVPKTAGNSVRAAMEEALGPDRWADVFVPSRTSACGRPVHLDSPEPDVAGAVAGLRARQHDLSGAGMNLPYGVHEVLDRPVRYFSVVREPVARLVSYWYFVARMRDERPQWDLFAGYGFDIAKILAEHADVALENDQVRMLAGTSRLDLTADDLALAKHRIEHDYAFVLTTETVATGLPARLGALGVHCGPVPRDNVGDYADPSLLPDGGRELFAEANRLDTALYRWVRDEYLPGRLRFVG